MEAEGGAQDLGEDCVFGQLFGDGVRAAFALEQGGLEQVDQQVGRDVVHHDGQDDFVGTGLGFEDADDTAPDCTA